MKNLRDFLNEFRENSFNKNNQNSGDNPIGQVMEAMRKIPFTHVLTGEHELHFKDSLNAANVVSRSLSTHENGFSHANKMGNENMHEYFLGSIGTHEDVLDSIINHVANHPNMPSHLSRYVPEAVEQIQSNNSKNTSDSEKEHIMGRFSSGDSTRRHEHLLNDTHHLGDVIKHVQSNPDDGYFLEKEEYKED